jgi:hypothetical protein
LSLSCSPSQAAGSAIITLAFTITLPPGTSEAQANNENAVAALQATLAAQLGVPASSIVVSVAPAPSRRVLVGNAARALAAGQFVYTAVVTTTTIAAGSLQASVSTISASSPAQLNSLLGSTLSALSSAGLSAAAAGVAVTVNGVSCPAPCNVNSILTPAAPSATNTVNVGAIVGGVVGGLAFVTIVVVGTLFCLRAKARGEIPPPPAANEGAASGGSSSYQNNEEDSKEDYPQKTVPVSA